MPTFSPIVRRLAFWTIPVAFGVMGLKALAWYVTGSVALLSDALESTVNVIAAIVAYAAIRYSQKPADHDHQFGHYKAEYLSAVIEGVMIVVAALLIVRQASADLLAPELPQAPVLGLSINLAAAAINAIWAWALIRAGKANHSPALTADGRHILSDVVTSGGVLVGLLLVLATGYAILDPIMALIVAVNILFQGWKVISHSLDGLMDRAVTPEEETDIKQAIADHATGSIGVHDLRTRRAGPAVFIDFHLVVPKNMAVGDAHAICDRLEDAIHAIISGASIAIHVEPEGEKAHGRRVKI
ncbi:cation diffusion facilitator family transporter [Rhizobium sp. L1K21]|uniref:cation diffusion facilitator family transporter n=1 Tax=Rhizobium sp. L1K21 TaxID=2954933 RepID=UPI002092B6E1|nr:cation diffusion facilitator family transporter [Rhizobium sp. L1K21]MCO6185396.1 cation diffusion facilitator family transporter [Rhizobium sp. L1K21]